MEDKNIEKKETIDNVLKLMDRANEVFSYEIWVPSLGKEIMFREINTSQQKRLIKSVIDSPIYNTEFIFTLRKIIKENCVDPEVDIDQLTLLDKISIAISMRINSIGDIVEMEFESDDGPVPRGISLKNIQKQIKKLKPLKTAKIVDDKGVYTLDCSIPSILTEHSLEQEFRSNHEIDDINTSEELRDTIGVAFINELIKYVNVLTIKTEENETVINLNDVDFSTRIKLIEKLPERLTSKLIDYIEKIKKELDKVILIKVEIDKEGKKQMLEERLSIDGGFFTAS